jgi:hypothetical protein
MPKWSSGRSCAPNTIAVAQSTRPTRDPPSCGSGRSPGRFPWFTVEPVAVVRRFPFGVYFRVYARDLVILAVIHGRRHPRQWARRRPPRRHRCRRSVLDRLAADLSGPAAPHQSALTAEIRKGRVRRGRKPIVLQDGCALAQPPALVSALVFGSCGVSAGAKLTEFLATFEEPDAKQEAANRQNHRKAATYEWSGSGHGCIDDQDFRAV